MGSRPWRARKDRGRVLRSCAEGAARSRPPTPTPHQPWFMSPPHRSTSQQWPVPGLQLRCSMMLTTEAGAALEVMKTRLRDCANARNADTPTPMGSFPLQKIK